MTTLTVEAALATARVALVQAEQRAQAAVAEVERVKAEVRGLELALSRAGGTSVAPVPEEATVAEAPARAMTRTDAVLKILVDAGRAVSRKEIRDRLVTIRGNNPADTSHAVGGALAYLAKEGRVRSAPGRGMWAAVSAGEERMRTRRRTIESLSLLSTEGKI